MRASLSRLLLSTGLALSALLAIGASAAPGSGITGTAHDFTGGYTDMKGVLHANSTTVGVCTFCHTPHKAITTKLLWNHTLTANNFSWDVASTTAGTTYPTIAGGTYKGPTAKCLSCHDGSVAIGDVAWFKEQPNQGASALNTFKLGSDGDTSHVVGSSGAMSGNHPVAMPYPYGQAANTYNGVATGSGAVLTEWQTNPVALNSAGVSQIRLFNDDGTGNISAGVATAKTGIECSTCHDPHNKAAVDQDFLRGKITGSAQTDGYLCLQCHIK